MHTFLDFASVRLLWCSCMPVIGGAEAQCLQQHMRMCRVFIVVMSVGINHHEHSARVGDCCTGLCCVSILYFHVLCALLCLVFALLTPHPRTLLPLLSTIRVIMQPTRGQAPYFLNRSGKQLLLDLLTPSSGGILWRTSKQDVAQELGIPLQVCLCV